MSAAALRRYRGHSHLLVALVLFGAGALAPVARARNVETEIVWRLAVGLNAATPKVEGAILLEPVGGGDAISIPPRDGRVTASTPPGLYHLRLEAAGFWAADQIVEAGRAVTLDIYPRGQLAGRVLVPETAAEPRLRARFRTPTGAVERGGIDGEMTCDLGTDGFTCDLPALTLDVELRVDGFVPVYLWDQTITAGARRPTGSHRLETGASVVGWVVDEGAPAAGRRDLEVELVPNLGETPAVRHRGNTAERLALTRRRQRPSARGFFQFRGVRPGAYTAIARAPDGATTQRLAFEVASTQEVRLAEPLVLTPPARLEVVVDPPLAPNDDPWRLTLLAAARGETINQAHADWGGAWTADGLEPGRYRLLVEVEGRTPAHTQRWWQGEVEVTAPTTFLPVTLSWVDVEGDIRDAEGPVVGALFFGGRFGAPRVVLESDDEGRFFGALPREGSWQVDFAIRAQDTRTIRLEDVDVTEGPSGKALLDLLLSNRRLAGRVVTEEGKGVAGAFVRVLSPERRAKEAETTTAGDGQFELAYLRAGEVWVEAEGHGGRAEPLRVDLNDEATSDLELVLRQDREFTGRVTVDGRGQTGALVRAIGLSGTGAPVTVAKALSDHESTFRLRLPAAAERAVVIVRHALGATDWQTIDVRRAVEDGVDIDLSTQAGRLTVTCTGFPAAALVGPGGELGIHLLADRRESDGDTMRFEIDRLAPAWYRVCPVTDRPRYDRCQPLLVTPGGNYQVHLETDVAASTTTGDR